MYQFMTVRVFSYCLATTFGGGESFIIDRGYPIIPLKEFAACRMVYRESKRKDLESGLKHASARFKIDASPRFRPAPTGLRICKLNQNIMTDLGGAFGTTG